MNVPDVSLYQGDIDWPQVAQAGITRVIVKLSEGVNIADPKASANCDGARAAGIVPEGYHFARLAAAATANAQQAITRAQACGVTRVWLDFEDPNNPLGPEDSTTWVLAFLAAIGEAGLSAGFYTYSGYASHLAPHAELAAYPLWLANYGSNDGTWPPTRRAPSLPAPWETLTGWQHTSTATVPGIAGDVDMSTFTDEETDMPLSDTDLQKIHDACAGAVHEQVLDIMRKEAIPTIVGGVAAAVAASGGGKVDPQAVADAVAKAIAAKLEK